MRRVWAAAALVTMAAAPVMGQERPGFQTITAHEIRRSGITSLAEIPLLADDWDLVTIDGFSWSASPRALAPHQRERWTVWVDGRRVDLDLFGTRNLNRLPISLAEIDSVCVVSLPGVTAGAFVDAGALHIYTSRPEAGLSIRGRYVGGNETGDPGPYRFTRFRTPNIDKDPPDFSATVSYAIDSAYLRAGVTRRRYFPTDPAIGPRNRAILDGRHPTIEVIAPSVTVGAHALGGQHRLHVGASWTDDMLFLAPLGRELPTESRLTDIGGGGSLRLGRGATLSYRTGYSSNRLDHRQNARALDPDWDLDRWHAAIALQRRTAEPVLQVGFEVRGASAATTYALDPNGYTGGALFAKAVQPFGDRLRAGASGNLELSGGRVGFGVAVHEHWRAAEKHALEARLTYSERLIEEDNSIWYWTQRGYGFLADAGVDATIEDGALAGPRRATADLHWRYAPGPFELGVGAYYRRFAHAYLATRELEFSPEDRSFAGPTRVHGGRDGSLGGVELELRGAPVSRLSFRARYRYQDALTGDPAFRAAWATIPEHRVDAIVEYVPVPSFSLWSRVHYRSNARWPDYRAAADASDGLYSADLDAFLTLDLAIQKWFWDRRIRGNVLLRNVPDASVLYHPIGATQSLGLYVQLELRLDGL